jgi:hypothetical protein
MRMGLLLWLGFGNKNENTKGQRRQAAEAVRISVLYNETVLNFKQFGHS